MNVKDNVNIISSKNRKRILLTKKEKQETLKLGKTEILRKAKKLNKHTERNLNTNHINYKLFYLLLDPFTFVNAYTKISKNKGAVYVRYPNDWVLALTCNQEKAEKIKSDISSYLEVHRKMQLDDEKTKITRLSKGCKFLGFETRMNITKPKLKRVLMKDVNGKYSRPLRRTTSRLITVEPGSESILQRLKNNKFCDKLGYPKGKAAWTVYDEFEIVQKFAQIFRGLFVYYLPCGRLSRLSNASYILQQGGTARSCDGNMSITLFDKQFKLADLRKIMKQLSCNKAERKLARTLANKIHEISVILSLPANLYLKIQKKNLERKFTMEEKGRKKKTHN